MKWSAPLERPQNGCWRTCASAARTASAVALPAPSHSLPQKSVTWARATPHRTTLAQTPGARDALSMPATGHTSWELCAMPVGLSSITQWGMHLFLSAHGRRRRVRLPAVRPLPEPVEQAPQIYRYEEQRGRVGVARAQAAAQEVLVQLHIICMIHRAHIVAEACPIFKVPVCFSPYASHISGWWAAMLQCSLPALATQIELA